jgi:uncharacterized protein
MMRTDAIHATDATAQGPGPQGANMTDACALLSKVGSQIAPTWPLDRFIAVNPFWEMIGAPLPSVAAKLAALTGARLLMPRAWYHEAWRRGELRDEHLAAAIAQSSGSTTLAELHGLMESSQPIIATHKRLMDLVDLTRNLDREVSCRDFVTHNTSQFCAAYFDEDQAGLPPDRDGGLYASWRRQALTDKSPALLLGLTGYAETARLLPETPEEMAALALADLAVPESAHESYVLGLLLDLNGWAAWCAYLRWNARLAGDADAHIVEFAAMRLAWEWLLLKTGGPQVEARWRKHIASWPAMETTATASQRRDWLLQDAMEIAWQRRVAQGLVQGLKGQPSPSAASVQAVFCIDVRSEVFRRALEAESGKVQTRGFAGFFGLPVEYQGVGAPGARPQLPGLLAPALRVADVLRDPSIGRRRESRLEQAAQFRSFKTGANSSFSFVESMGLSFAGKLLAETLDLARRRKNREAAGLSAREHAQRKPRLLGSVRGEATTVSARCTLARGILRGMGLTGDFARLVVLVGHGSESSNNPHAAGLDCGACCGQTGEVNARAAAALLNEADVRSGLVELGITIPATTHFLPAMHNTTTDEVFLFDVDELPSAHEDDLEQLKGWLRGAGFRARRERSAAIGQGGLDDAALEAATLARARDWSQVRPEWGLANNASFIVAPRERTRQMNLGGRSFLHDYRFQDDENFDVLELIMTAPMVVTHWINFQYYASTVDNARYGSGNKVLHNVVGGHIGVFEGNGGDLRIGLPMQSLHDGQKWIHTPLRLSVFIEAPRDAIAAVLAKHESVRALVENGWLHLFQIDAEEGAVHCYRSGCWQAFDVEAQGDEPS